MITLIKQSNAATPPSTYDGISILAAIVLYDETLETSVTWNTLKTNTPAYVSWMVVNNGPKPIRLPDDYSGSYYEDLSNGGLAAAYAYALAYSRQNRFKYLLLLDQDTRFSCDFWEKQRQTISRYPKMSLYLPTIYGERFLLSPCFFRHGLGAPATLDELPAVLTFKKYSFINSGSLFSVTDLTKVWDSRICELFMDNVDHAIAHYLFKYRKMGAWFRVNNIQRFSGDCRDRELLLRRLKIWVRDARIFGRLSGTFLWQNIWIIYRCAGLFWRYQDVRFLGCLAYPKPCKPRYQEAMLK